MSTKKHTARNITIVVALVIAGFVAVLATRTPVGDDVTGRSPLLGRLAPEFEGASIMDGKEVSLTSLRSGGRYVLLNFFGSYCVPCIKEHPDLIKIAEAHPNDVALVSVTFGDNVDDARDFFKTKGGDWPVLDIARVAVDYGVAQIPETFVISPDGYVISKAAGPITAKRFEQVLAKAEAART